MRKEFKSYHGTPITGLLYTQYKRVDYLPLYMAHKADLSKKIINTIEKLLQKNPHFFEYDFFPTLPIERVFKEYMTDRRVLIPFLRREDEKRTLEYAKSFILDNSAFSVWKQGKTVNWNKYYDWVETLYDNPKLDWFIIPDVIMGTEEENDALLDNVPTHLRDKAVPVWHTNESHDRLQRLAKDWDMVCIGSADNSTIGDMTWSANISEAIEAISINGIPTCKLHALRCLDVDVFPRFPFDSGDSTNFAQNHNKSTKRGLEPTTLLECELLDTPVKNTVYTLTKTDSLFV